MPPRDFSRTLRWMRESTDHRRTERSKRKRTVMLISLSFLALAVVGLPSFLCFTPFVHAMLAAQGEPYEWDVRAQSISIGWITPLHIRQLEAVGPSGETVLAIDRIDADVTVIDLLRGETNFGTLHLDQPQLQTQIHAGGSSLESDLESLLTADTETGPLSGEVQLRNGVIQLADPATQRVWRSDQLQATLRLGDATELLLETVVTAHDQISGALQAKVVWNTPQSGANPASTAEISASLQGLPLSLLELVTLRIPDSAARLPQQWSGNATGDFYVTLHPERAWTARTESLDLRNLVVMDPAVTGPQPWKMGQAILRGSATQSAEQVELQNLFVETEAGTVQGHGTLNTTLLSKGQYLEALRGDVQGDIDLAVLTQSTPGLIPIRTDAVIESGRVSARVRGQWDANQQYRTQWDLRTEPIRARTAQGKPVVLDPMTLALTLRPTANWVIADALRLDSSFGRADASGDLRQGQASFDLDFGRLANLLGQILELPETTLGGSARGQVRWSATSAQDWNLTGSASGRQLVLQWQGGPRIERPRLDLQVSADGVWQQGRLQQLRRAAMTIEEPSQQWSCDLTEPVVSPDSNTLWPLELRGGGDLAELSPWIRAILPASLAQIESLSGSASATIRGRFSPGAGQIQNVALEVRQLGVQTTTRRYRQAVVKSNFAGQLDYPSGQLHCRSWTLSGNAVALAMQGQLTPESANLELAYRGDLAQIQAAIETLPGLPNVARAPNVTRDRAGTPTTGPSPRDTSLSTAPWLYFGSVEGKADLERDGAGGWLVRSHASGTDLQALRADQLRPLSDTALPRRNTSRSAAWAESHLDLQCTLRIDPQRQETLIEQLQCSTPWLLTDFSGSLLREETGWQMQLDGPLEMETSTLARRISGLTDQPLTMRGRHTGDVRLVLRQSPDTEAATWQVDTQLSWENAEMAGVRIGGARVPLRVTDRMVSVGSTVLPLEQGTIYLAGDVHYAATEPWCEVAPGKFAEGVRLTPEMCRSWLKYVMPLVANTTEVQGQFSVDLEQCVVSFPRPETSVVRGTLQVESASVGPGPITQSLLAAVDSLKFATRGLTGAPLTAEPSVQWIRIPPQAIDFVVQNGRVSHQRIMLNAGNVQLVSSGHVELDGRLGLAVEIPLLPQWLGGDLSSLAGQQLTLPIGGSFARPQIDSSAVAQAIGTLGGQAVQRSAENYLQQQFDRQLRKLGDLIGPVSDIPVPEFPVPDLRVPDLRVPDWP